jgi:hypothetical protein
MWGRLGTAAFIIVALAIWIAAVWKHPPAGANY